MNNDNQNLEFSGLLVSPRWTQFSNKLNTENKGQKNVQQSSEVFEYMKRFLTRMDLIEVNGVW